MQPHLTSYVDWGAGGGECRIRLSRLHDLGPLVPPPQAFRIKEKPSCIKTESLWGLGQQMAPLFSSPVRSHQRIADCAGFGNGRGERG